MTRVVASRFLVSWVLAVAVVACNGKKAQGPVPEAEPARDCKTHDDCEGNWVCLAGVCTDSSSKAIYTDPKNAVTPEKMFNHLQEAAENSANRADEALGM